MLALAAAIEQLPRTLVAAALLLIVAGVLAAVRAARGRLLDAGSAAIVAAALFAVAAGAYGSRATYRAYLKRLGLNLPTVELLAAAPQGERAGVLELRAHATDKPGTRGPIAAVRSVEFWLYHPSFAEQHAGNHESKVLLAAVAGPTDDDEYAAVWTCRNPFRPARDGDHGGGAGTRTYVLPDDGRRYSVQAHALDDEFYAHPKMPAKSHPIVLDGPPCARGAGAAANADSPASVAATEAPSAGDWRSDWEVADGFALDVDTEGFRFPTSIAFVPRPGAGAKDPLYFVTELRGTLKVVTNDRTVAVFADDFPRYVPPAELPDVRAEAGLVSVCLDARTGYVFASYAYADERGSLRNAIVRFETTPQTFALRPLRRKVIADVLASFPSSRAHQIGHLVIHQRALWVGVGDALDATAVRRLDTVQGKILRMTLDGEPFDDNPFAAGGAGSAASGDAAARARRYVWSSGLRNPFGLAVAGDALLAADNGPSIDRVLRVERGRDYAFDGSDWSAGTNALAVFAPAVGPAQVAWLPHDSELFPPVYRGALYVALGGSTQTRKGPGLRGEKSVVLLPLDVASHNPLAGARPILRYAGDGAQMPVGVAFGPDGLYVAPLFAMRDGRSAVLRLRWAPEHAHPHAIDRGDAPLAMLSSLGCIGCHSPYEGRGAPAPSLDPRSLVRRLRQRLSSPEYADAVAAVDALDTSPFTEYRDARRAVLAAEGREQVRLWLAYRLREPRFDSPDAMMPNQGVTAEQADRIATWLVDHGWPRWTLAAADDDTAAAGGLGGAARAIRAIKDALPAPRHRHTASAFALGALTACTLAWAVRRPRP